MEDQSMKELPKLHHIENFIKNPFDKHVKPKHLVSVLIDKKRAKSLLRKVDRNFQVEEKEQPYTSGIEIYMTPEQLLREMERKGHIHKKQKKLLCEQLYLNPLADELRKKHWFVSSGAKIKQEEEPEYYRKVCNELINYPNYFEPIIELDLKRTFPDRNYDPNDDFIQQMRRVLNSYAKRNPFIGYCQGLNFVVARVIEVVNDEEKAFWILCALLEDILPIDYFSSMVGVLVDQKIFSDLVNNYDKELGKKFSDLEVDPSLFSLQWFVCCYVSTLSAQLCNIIWDLMFLEGGEILFKAGLVFLSNLKPKIIAVKEFNELFPLIEGGSEFTNDLKEFTKNLQSVYISKRLLKLLRKQYQWIVEKELQDIEGKKKPRNNFMLPKEVLTCNLDWPVCTDVLEKSKQKKRNTSMFALRSDRGKAPKSSYLTTEFKHTHHHKNQLLKRLRNKERGRDRQIKIDMAPEQGHHLLKGYGYDTKEKGNNISDLHIKNKDVNSEGTKISENPFIVQNHLVIGRHKHTCQESMDSKKSFSKKQPPLHKREKLSRMEEYVKDSLADVRDDRSPLPIRGINSKHISKTESNIPQITYQTISSPKLEKSAEKKEGGGVSSLLRGLFGSTFMKSEPAKIKRKGKGQNVSSSSDEETNSPQILVRMKIKDREDVKERRRPKKSIYNYLMEQDFGDLQEKNFDSETKSFLFMKEFFKE